MGDQPQDRNLEKIVEKVVNAASLPADFLNVLFADASEMRALNLKWRGKNALTDVLSFEAGDNMPGAPRILGDLVICIPKALEQAKNLGHALEEEVAVLAAHGITHLLGFDHELSEEDALKQKEFEMAILDRAGFRPELCLIDRS